MVTFLLILLSDFQRYHIILELMAFLTDNPISIILELLHGWFSVTLHFTHLVLHITHACLARLADLP